MVEPLNRRTQKANSAPFPSTGSPEGLGRAAPGCPGRSGMSCIHGGRVVAGRDRAAALQAFA